MVMISLGCSSRGSSSSTRPGRQQFALPGGSKLPPELVHRTVHFEYTHGDTSRGDGWVLGNSHHNPTEGFWFTPRHTLM